jgi:transposase InsO family protein
MANLGHTLGRGTIRRILKDRGIEPAPERGKGIPWSVFLKAHWKALVAADFFSVEVWSWRGLTTHYVLFVIDLATRRIRAGITVHPNADWMMQVGRNPLDVVDGPLVGKKYLILDRDTKYCAAFRQMLAREGIRVIRLPPRSPNLNAYAERWVRSVRAECLSKVIPIGQGMLHRALREYVAHHHLERNHQGLGNALITPCAIVAGQNEPSVAGYGSAALVCLGLGHGPSSTVRCNPDLSESSSARSADQLSTANTAADLHGRRRPDWRVWRRAAHPVKIDAAPQKLRQAILAAEDDNHVTGLLAAWKRRG